MQAGQRGRWDLTSFSPSNWERKATWVDGGGASNISGDAERPTIHRRRACLALMCTQIIRVMQSYEEPLCGCMCASKECATKVCAGMEHFGPAMVARVILRACTQLQQHRRVARLVHVVRHGLKGGRHERRVHSADNALRVWQPKAASDCKSERQRRSQSQCVCVCACVCVCGCDNAGCLRTCRRSRRACTGTACGRSPRLCSPPPAFEAPTLANPPEGRAGGAKPQTHVWQSHMLPMPPSTHRAQHAPSRSLPSPTVCAVLSAHRHPKRAGRVERRGATSRFRIELTTLRSPRAQVEWVPHGRGLREVGHLPQPPVEGLEGGACVCERGKRADGGSSAVSCKLMCPLRLALGGGQQDDRRTLGERA